jgi:succinate dehydrogenase/fumarate reductase iron-sulfur protein
MSEQTARTNIRIQRGGQDAPGSTRFEEYTIDCEPGSTVLDALRAIQFSLDPTLGFRWECRAGICGACTVMIDDTPRLSCETPLEQGQTVTVAPLLGFRVIKDLIVDLSPVVARLAHLRPYLISPNEASAPVDRATADRSKQFRRCIECCACVAAIGPVNIGTNARLDVIGIVKLARFATDPRDTENRVALARVAGIATYTQRDLQVASAVCPKHIDIVAAYGHLTSATGE